MRLKIEEVDKKALDTMFKLEEYLSTTFLTKQEKQLIKIRASQINSCAFCLNMHITEARKNGETKQRIDLLSAWKETQNIYSDEEKVLLSIAEQVTLIHRVGLSDEVYSKSIQYFGEEKTAQAIMAAIIINSWNRLCVALKKEID